VPGNEIIGRYMEEKNRKLKVYRGTNKSYQTIPQIKFEGQWLESLGFSVGDKIQLDYEENKITITKLSASNG
jgi:toxic protein SymE